MRAKKWLWGGGLAFALLLILAAAFVGPLIAASLRSDALFLRYQSDSRIRYEAGAEATATILARELPDAIAAVEKLHGEKFPQSITVHACASLKTFGDFTAVPSAGGIVLNKRLFISPKENNTPERLYRILRHELSHLHLDQKLGASAHLHIPSWFQEGIAVVVSNGGGAENVTPTEAVRAILDGRHFVLRDSGNILLRLTGGATDGLPQHLFYRQSGLFVAFMRDSNPTAFDRFMKLLLSGETFTESIRSAYGQDLLALWQEFATKLPASAR